MQTDLPPPEDGTTPGAVEVLPKEPEVTASDLELESVEETAHRLFKKAAERLETLLDDPDPAVQVRAATKIVDLQMVVYRQKKTAKRPVVALDKLFDDGLTF